ncbi:hypothetical protein N0V82_005348 [Gnomoniopsis sp. IMI 355080]|nr:hypothetical protein N0V82_005348 [Gnomoniopsis sp. IMI 355080]
MRLNKLQSQALNGLCSGDRLQLLDSIDSLRSQGIDHFVSLPQIIVCGDQSAGKSSVLEAISGVSFPIKSNLCTRFPTELILRRTPQVGVSISIVPHHSRSDKEKESLSAFNKEVDSIDGFALLIEDAKSALGVSTHGNAFSRDLLRVEVSGPDRPHLTIVDLPGLIHSETKHQAASDVELIKDVVKSYMNEPRSIILAVVSAKNDFANQVVLKLARLADPTGGRTMGIITKPDTLVPGSQSEAVYASLAKNEEVEFRLGWHVLKNMDSETGKGSLTERNALEVAFFNQSFWKSLPSANLGIIELRSRLSKVLLRHIASELPGLVQEIESKRVACCDKLTKLGQPRVTLSEQQLHLVEVSQSFQRLVKSAVDANCTDRFFDNAETKRGYQLRIRAVVQNMNTEFANDLYKNGHCHHILGFLSNTVSSPNGKTCVSRDDFIDHIETKIRKSRGRELPGLFDPMIVADLFREQASPWGGFVTSHVDRVWRACKTFVKHVLAHVADTGTATALTQKVLEPAMHTIMTCLQAKTAEVLRSHQTIHPISYNEEFTETVQRIRATHQRSQCASIVMSHFDVSNLEERSMKSSNLSTLVDDLVKSFTEPDMNRFAATEALDYMEAYYKVAMKRIVDDVAVEIIEVCLVSMLVDVLSPVKVFRMTPELISFIAGESQDKQNQRKDLMRHLGVLNMGAKTCENFVSTHCKDFGMLPEEAEQEDPDQYTDSDGETFEKEKPLADVVSPRVVNSEEFAEVPEIVCDLEELELLNSAAEPKQWLESQLEGSESVEWFSSSKKKKANKKKTKGDIFRD